MTGPLPPFRPEDFDERCEGCNAPPGQLCEPWCDTGYTAEDYRHDAQQYDKRASPPSTAPADPRDEAAAMPHDLTTQEGFDAFAELVAQKLGTHCRTEPNTEYARGLARVIVDDEGRALRLCQPDEEQPDRLKIYAAIPHEDLLSAPSIGVTAISARHVAREITRRLYPLQAEFAEMATGLAARRQTEARGRAAVAEAVAGALPGARVDEQHRRTRIVWEHDCRAPGEYGPIRADSVDAFVDASGQSVRVEVSGRPECVIAMLAAFARAAQE